MRRALSIVPAIVLVLFFGLGPLSALAGASDDDASLPACCRRLGAHHCALTAVLERMMRSSSPSFSAPATCPLYPGAAAAIFSPVFTRATEPASRPATAAQAFEGAAGEVFTPSGPNRTHAGRGPPAQS